jgi:hypothetical protein
MASSTNTSQTPSTSLTLPSQVPSPVSVYLTLPSLCRLRGDRLLHLQTADRLALECSRDCRHHSGRRGGGSAQQPRSQTERRRSSGSEEQATEATREHRDQRGGRDGLQTRQAEQRQGRSPLTALLSFYQRQCLSSQASYPSMSLPSSPPLR